MKDATENTVRTELEFHEVLNMKVSSLLDAEVEFIHHTGGRLKKGVIAQIGISGARVVDRRGISLNVAWHNIYI